MQNEPLATRKHPAERVHGRHRGAIFRYRGWCDDQLCRPSPPPATLAQTTGTAITLDTTAADHGWFLDYTPYLNEEFLPTHSPYIWTAREDTEAWGRMDLLTVLLHEVGHVAGLEHDADGLMAATLAPGVRVLPDADELAALQAMRGDSPLLAAHTAPESPTAPRDDAPGLPNSQARGATLIRSARQRPSGLTGLAAADTSADTSADTAPDAGAPRYATAAHPTLTNPVFNGATGWTTLGDVRFASPTATLTESAASQTRLNQVFVLGAGARTLSFTLDGLVLDDMAAASLLPNPLPNPLPGGEGARVTTFGRA
jgi:hypothetical protein